MQKENNMGQALFDEAAAVINGGRQDVYGRPEHSFGLIGKYWSAYLGLDVDALDVAHMMMLFKIARLSGQAVHRDNYIDIAGYTAIAADRILMEAGDGTESSSAG